MRGEQFKMSLTSQIDEKEFTNAHELVLDKFDRNLFLKLEERVYVLIEKAQKEAWF